MGQTCLEGTVLKRLLYYFDESKYVLLALCWYKVQCVFVLFAFLASNEEETFKRKKVVNLTEKWYNVHRDFRLW